MISLLRCLDPALDDQLDRPYRVLGEACGRLAASLLEKQADVSPELSYGLSGRLYLSQSGWLLLSVPNALGRGAFDALNEQGAELPADQGENYNAHISVMRPDELEQIGGPQKVTERGHEFRYTLGPVRSIEPAGWPEMSKVWFIEISSPELEKLRKSYGLPPLPKEGKYKFHVTFACRRRNVLRDNDISKDQGRSVEHVKISADEKTQALLEAVANLPKDGILDLWYHPEKDAARVNAGDWVEGSVLSSWVAAVTPHVAKVTAADEMGQPGDDWVKVAENLTTREMIARQARHVREPVSDAQAEAGNYRKGHIRIHAYPVTIETAKGRTRSGVDKNGKPWSVTLTAHYGYIRQTESEADGDHLDVFVGENPDSELVFVVDQFDPGSGKFDEHKIMLGYDNEEDAKAGYLSNYSENWKGFGDITPMTMPQFDWWVEHGNSKHALAGQQLKAADVAPGLPNRNELGDLAKIQAGQLLTWLIQRHLAKRAGPHYDIRMGTPETGLYSWATKGELPIPGEKRFLAQQPVHRYRYKDYEGEIPPGKYGAGHVSKVTEGQILVTDVKPNRLSFTLASKGQPERFTMIQPPGWQGKDWLLINTTPTDPLPYQKVRYTKIPQEQIDQVFEQMKPGASAQAKIDGASNLIQVLKDGIEMVSYRQSAETGRPIVHTERFFRGRPKMQIPPELVGSVMKGEMYGLKDDKAIHPSELGGLLNSTVGRSITEQQARGIALRNMLVDIQQYGQQPVNRMTTPYADRRKMMQTILQHLPQDQFHLPEEATTPEDARALWQRISSGEHPLTEEGMVFHPPLGNPSKVKLMDENDVWLTGVFPGEGKYQGHSAGGFTYATAPGGATVGKVGTGLSDEFRRSLWEQPQNYVGRAARVRSQEQHPSGAHRVPSFLALHEDYPLAKTAAESWVQRAVTTTPLKYDVNQGVWQNIVNHFNRVRGTANTMSNAVSSWDRIQENLNPDLSLRRTMHGLQHGFRQPHWLDKILVGPGAAPIPELAQQ